MAGNETNADGGPSLLVQADTRGGDHSEASVQGLYGWIFPNLPEDLAFYWPDGGPMLGTISHERLAFLNLEEEEADAFRREAPHISLRSQREQSH